MKLLKLSIVFFFAVFTTNAQISKGQFIVGGSLNLSNFKSSASYNGSNHIVKTTSFGLNSNVGYFVADKFVVGPSVQYYYFKEKGENSQSWYQLGAFARYYFLEAKNKINILGQIGYDFGKNLQDGEAVADFNGLLIKAGPVFFLNDKTALEVTLDYNTSKIKTNITSTTNALSLNVGFQIHFN